MEIEQQVLEQECQFQNDEDVSEFQCQRSFVNYEEERTENRTVNLQSQIDTKKLMITEAKNFINMQEQFNLRKVTTLQQNHEINKNIDALKMKIEEKERYLAENDIMAGNEEQKLVENMTLAQSTRDILDMLSKYMENFQQRVSLLQTSTINVDFEKIYGSRLKNLLDKAKEIEHITLPFDEYNKNLLDSEELQNEIEENKKIKISLQKKKLLLEERQHRIEDNLSVLDKKIQEKIEEIQEQSEEIERIKKENFELERNILDIQKCKSIEMQELIFQRVNLKDRIASSEALYMDVEKDLKKTLLENTNLDKEMEIFRTSSDDPVEIEICVLESTPFSELEAQKENLLINSEQLKEELKILREKESVLDQLNRDEKINLLNLEATIADLQKELFDLQKLYNEEKLQMANREQEKNDMEKIIEENISNMEIEKHNLEVQQQNLKEIEAHLELLKSDTTKQKIEYEYQRKTVLPYLETKLEDLKKKFSETEERVSIEQTKLEEKRALKIKKIEQCNKAKRYFLMYTDTTKVEKSTKSMDVETKEYETQENKAEKTIETIEEEQPTDEISAKSILKSPKSSAPQTPKKNVTFTGVPDSESCSSYDTSIRGDKSCKNNRCFFCPKVFCCTECRYKHERIFHKKEIFQIYAQKPKPLLYNNRNQFSKSTKKPLSAIQVVNIPEVAESSPKTPQDSGKVEQLIMKFSSTASKTNPAKEGGRKSVDHEESIYQGDSQQFCRQIGATSTPYQINNANNGNDISVENEEKNNVTSNGPTYEITIPRFVSQPTKLSKSNLNKYEDTQCSMDVELSDISDFMNYSRASKDLKLKDTPNSIQTVQNPTSSIRHKDATIEEQDNLVNEETDSKATDTILWVTANSFEDRSERNEGAAIPSNHKEEVSSAEYIKEQKLCSSRSEPAGGELKVTNIVLNQSHNSITDLSHSVWLTITNSLRSALNTTRDICNITTNISKRSLDIIDYPIAKRRKYEPFLKCRPTIHDLGDIVMSKVNSTAVLKQDKATQTEDCYFV